jgi:anti-sigma factor RsiW
MTLYLDEELQGSERIDFEKHMSKCKPCHLRLQNERELLEIVRKAASRYVAATDLRARVEKLLNYSETVSTLRPQHAEISLWRKNLATPGLRTVITGAVVIAFLFALGFWLVTQEQRGPIYSGPSEFALMAAETHLRHLRGQLPLEIASDAPQRISSWFDDKLPFSVKLPNYQESSGQEKLYELEGARLVGYKNDYAAYVAYQMRQRQISLVITSNSVARPSGGQEIVAKGLTFHYDSINGFKVITWSDRGLTYALVSDLEERGQQSCVVCHHGTNDQEFIESLKP